MRQPRIALEAAHARLRKLPRQQHVFARAFHTTAPTRIAGDIHHGCKGPVDAHSGGLHGGGTRGAPCQLRLEAGRFGQRHRKHGGVAVDHVGGEQQRNPQPALHGRLLQLAMPAHVGAVEHTGQPPGPGRGQLRAAIGSAVQRVGDDRLAVLLRRAKQAELAGFLLHAHAGNQCIDKPGCVGRRRGHCPASGNAREQGQAGGALQELTSSGACGHGGGVRRCQPTLQDRQARAHVPRSHLHRGLRAIRIFVLCWLWSCGVARCELRARLTRYNADAAISTTKR